MKTPQRTQTAKQQADSIHADRLRAAGKFDEAAAFEARHIRAVKVTKPCTVPGNARVGAGTVLLVLPQVPPPGFITAEKAAQLLANGTAEAIALDAAAALVEA